MQSCILSFYCTNPGDHPLSDLHTPEGWKQGFRARARERMVFCQSESESGSGSDKNSIALRSHYQSQTPKYLSKSSRRKNPEFLFCAVGARVLNMRPASRFSFSFFSARLNSVSAAVSAMGYTDITILVTSIASCLSS